MLSQTFKFLQGRECLRGVGFLEPLSKSRYLIINRILELKRALKVICFKPHFTDGGCQPHRTLQSMAQDTLFRSSLGF